MKITQDKLDMKKIARVAVLLGEAGVPVRFVPARIAAKDQEKRRGGAGDVRRLSPRS